MQGGTKVGAQEVARTKHVPRLQAAAMDISLPVLKTATSRTCHLHLLQKGNSTTNHADHKLSLPFSSPRGKDTRSNEVTMEGIKRPTFLLAVRYHHVLILRLEATVSQTRPRTAGCHRNQLAASSLITEDDQMSVSVLSRLPKQTCHTRNRKRIHSRLLHQWSSLHMLKRLSRNPNQNLPWTLTSTIRKSRGVQDLQESDHWLIEHRKLLQ